MTWRERIVAARERGAFTDADKVDSNSWCSCAVAEQRAMYPLVVKLMDPTGILESPDDLRLKQYGEDFPGGFAWAVRHDKFDAAEKALDAIEDRVLELKREL